MTESVGWLASFAAQRGLRYDPDADERWFRAWEPFTTLKVPFRYEHSMLATGGIGSLSIARIVQTIEVPGAEAPRDVGAWIAIVQDTRLEGSFATTSDPRSPFAEPMDLVTQRRRTTGDAQFDRSFATFSKSTEELTLALTPSLRKLLLGWRLELHAEIRSGGFILAPVTLGADLQSIQWLTTALHLFGEKASKRRA